MTYITSWEEFSKAAERLYLNDPMKVSFIYKTGSLKTLKTFLFTNSTFTFSLACGEIRQTKSACPLLDGVSGCFISSPVRKYRKSYCNHPGVGVIVRVAQMLKFLVKVFYKSISHEHANGSS